MQRILLGSVKEAGEKSQKALAPFDDLIILQRKEEETEEGESHRIIVGKSGDNSTRGADRRACVLDGAAEKMEAIKNRLLEMKGYICIGLLGRD